MIRRLVRLACTLSTAAALSVSAWAQQPMNDAQVAGNNTATAATGVKKVGIVGNAGATVDAAVGATAAANSIQDGGAYNITAPAPATGQQNPLQQDQAANLLSFPGLEFETGAQWGTGTSQNTLQYPTGTATPGQLSGAFAVLAQLDMSNSTFTAGAVTFQGTYDNSNWVTIPLAQVLNPNTFAQLTNPYTFVANTNQPFLIVMSGYVSVRAKLTTAITGSSTPTVNPYWASLASDKSIIAPLPAGTNTIGSVSLTLPTSILAGQQSVTASAAALATNTLTKGLCVEALSTNSISVYVGPSGVTTSTGIELPPKSSYCVAVSNSNAIYVIASTTGASVTWSGN